MYQVLQAEARPPHRDSRLEDGCTLHAVATFSHATNIGLSASCSYEASSEVDAFESATGGVAALIRRFDEVTNGS